MKENEERFYDWQVSMMTEWIRNVSLFAIFSSLVLMLAPDSSYRHEIEIVTGLIMLILVINPVTVFFNGDYDNGFQSIIANENINVQSILEQEHTYVNQKDDLILAIAIKKYIYSELQIDSAVVVKGSYIEGNISGGVPIENVEGVSGGVPIENVEEVSRGMPIEKMEDISGGIPIENMEGVSGGVPIENVEGVSRGMPIENVEGVLGGIPIENVEDVSGGIPIENMEDVSGGNIKNNVYKVVVGKNVKSDTYEVSLNGTSKTIEVYITVKNCSVISKESYDETINNKLYKTRNEKSYKTDNDKAYQTGNNKSYKTGNDKSYKTGNVIDTNIQSDNTELIEKRIIELVHVGFGIDEENIIIDFDIK